MGFTEKTNYLLETKSLLKDRINSLGGSITSGTTFRDYLVWLDSLYEALDEKTITGLPESLEGKCEQDGTPTPSSPIPINITTGRQVVSVRGKNLFETMSSSTSQGVTLTPNSDGSYTLNGTTTGVAIFNKTLTTQLPPGTYTVSYESSVPLASDFFVRIRKANGTMLVPNGIPSQVVGNNTTTNKTTFTSTDYGAIVAINLVTTGITYNNVNVKIQLEKGNTPSTYEEYKGNDYEINLGKSLFKFDDISGTKNGLTYSVSNGEISISGTSTSSSAFGVFGESSSSKLPILKKGETYTLSTTTPLTGLYLQINYYKEGSTTQYSLVSQVTSSTTFTTPNDFDRIAQIFVGSLANFSGNYTFNIQLEKGSKSSYSPYKTPIYLGKIGTYQDYIVKTSGKNLFDEIYPNIVDGTTKYISLYVGDGTFTMSSNVPLPSNDPYASLFFITGQATSGASTGGNGVYLNRPITIASTNGYVTIGYRIYGGINPEDYQTQVEKGNQATLYEPYGEGQWYIHKEIGRVVLNGSDTTFSGISGTRNTGYSRFYVSVPNPLRQPSNVVGKVMCNRLVAGTLDATYLGNEAITSWDGGDRLYLYINDIATYNLNNANTWLQTHNLVICYALATPTNTLIEDEELINQLNEIDIFTVISEDFYN